MKSKRGEHLADKQIYIQVKGEYIHQYHRAADIRYADTYFLNVTHKDN